MNARNERAALYMSIAVSTNEYMFDRHGSDLDERFNKRIDPWILLACSCVHFRKCQSAHVQLLDLHCCGPWESECPLRRMRRLIRIMIP